ncbi:uncharacterized protein [Eurosta solidaginis]|uniref:uncharacterized protein isoform X2 n=1 Tax=Eurosta solidaginis TaxID=178769 RepID=UPI003530FB3A
MDLKALLLNSISSKRPLLFNRRMHIGKSCYSVTFEVNGKLLTVTRIRQIYTKAPFQMRIQRRQKYLQKLKSSSSFGANESVKSNTTTPPPSAPLPPQYADCATQTSKPQMRSRTTETESQVFSVHRQQQTIRRFQRKQGTQTDPNTSSQAIQTERRTATRGTQTNDSKAETTSSQTENYCCSNQVQTEPQQEDQCGEREKEAVVFMLNEIGEMIINQNHLLQNNSTMLSQISEMTVLSKVAARQKGCKQMEKQHKMQRLSRKRARLRCIPMPIKQQLPADRRSQWVQTIYPIGLSSKMTQTRQEPRRHKRFRLFCFST